MAQSFAHALHLGDRFCSKFSLRPSSNAFELGYLASFNLLGDEVATVPQLSLSWTQIVEQNARLAFMKLPTDVWIRIFERHVVPNADSTVAVEEAVLALSSVCRILRHIFLDTSQLWTNFAVHHNRYSPLFFERCGTAPLSIRFDARHERAEALCHNWDNLKKHFYHTKSLVLRFFRNNSTLELSHVSELLQQSAPLLIKLKLIAHCTGGTHKTIPAGSFGEDWQRLQELELQNLPLDHAGSYPALSNITTLQYCNFGRVSPRQFESLFCLLPKIERLGLSVSDTTFEDFDSEPPVDIPSTLVQLALEGLGSEELKSVLAFFSRVPRIYARPEDDHYNRSICAEPWNQLNRVNVRLRRAIVEYHTADTLDTETKVLTVYARRIQIIDALTGSSARFLRTLLLDEGAWGYLASEQAWPKDRPVMLPTLATLRITLHSCVYAAMRASRGTSAIGFFAQPDFLAMFDMPSLNNFDLVFLSSWTCARVYHRAGATKSLKRCFCRNNGIVAMSQIVDLLRHLRGATERRLPQLGFFGVTDILDEDPQRNAEALKELVVAVDYHIRVPEWCEDEDEEVYSFHCMVNDTSLNDPRFEL